MPIVELINVNKSFGDRKIFDNFSLSIEAGEMVAITGDSGCGKSTLLNMIGLLEKCDSGEVIINGQKNIDPNSAGARKILMKTISYLFQNFALVEDETVKYNLLLALKYVNGNKSEKAAKIANALEQVGLPAFENKRLFHLSGGEQQRVAVARVMLKPCEIVLADEPTGSLDLHNREEIIGMLEKLNSQGKTVIIVTHDPYVAERCSKRIEL